MTHSLTPHDPREPLWRRAGVWGPAVAVLVVLVVVWASYFPGTGSSRVAADPSGDGPAQVPQSLDTDDADDPDDAEDPDEAGASTEGDGSGRSEGSGRDDAGRDGDDRADDESVTTSAELEASVKRFRAAQRRLAQQVSQQLEERSQPHVFRVASLNVLGASHTGPGGRPGYPSASPRMDMAIAALRNNAVDVVGFQEFEASQYQMFTARAGEYSLYPGLALGDKSVRFNIAWRSSMWTMVDAHTLSIPYAGGNRIQMPVVLLESTETGRRAWFANFHNPADTPNLGNNARWRAEAAAIEVAHLTELATTGDYPVISTGDYNEREEIFCRFTAGGIFSAAAGGSTGAGCAPPPSMQVDWIFGSTGVAFDGYAATDIGRASDHRLVHSQATLTAVE